MEYNVSNQSVIKLGVVGAGKIAPHHLRVAQKNGFSLDSICARDNSKSAETLGREFGIKNICNTFDEFTNKSVDAYLILTDTESQVFIARKLLVKNKPILIEKPVSANPDAIRSLASQDKSCKIVVGYNRRSLSSTRTLKAHLPNLPSLQFHVNVPELSSSPYPTFEDIRYMILENAVHVFDLVFYLFGEPESWQVTRIDSDDGFFARSINFHYKGAQKGVMSLTTGVPDNWSINVYSPGQRFVMSPLESFIHFTEMDSIAATLERPNKRYFPKSVDMWEPEIEDVEFKAGFDYQIRNFRQFVLTGTRPEVLASLSEAYFVSAFAKAVLLEGMEP